MNLTEKVYQSQDVNKFCLLIFVSKNIVGAGSSGSVVANRLSENFKVLLLEAGGEPYYGTYTPANALFMLTQPEVQWNFQTVPQGKACLAMNNHVSVYGWVDAKVSAMKINLLVSSFYHLAHRNQN